MNSTSRLPFHYGWVVVIAGSLLVLINSSLFLTFAVFLDPISQATGWSRAEVSGAYALHWMVGAVSVFGIGWFTDRFGTRRALFLGALLNAVSLALAARSGALWQLYLFYGGLFGVSRSTFLVPIHVTIGMWFRKRLGIAMGIVSVAMALGPLLLSPVIRYLIDVTDWRNTLLLLGLASGVLMVICSWFIRDQPDDLGLRAYGEAEAAVARAEVRPEQRPMFYQADRPDFFRYAAKTQPFGLMILVHFLGCVSHSIPLTHVVAMATDKGIAPMAAATILSLMSLFSMASSFGFSVLADVAGGKKSLALALFLQAGGILILLGSHDLWMFYLFTVVFGLGYGGEMVAFPILNRQYYGNAPIAKVYGAQMVGAGLGMAGGAYLGGLLFDLAGNYTWAIWGAAIIGYLGLASTFRLASPFGKPAVKAEARTLPPMP
ncbi:MAG: MFS transporter [Chloroflexi bacterium]|nr:MFS transporter [Chloroflexota bacterium]